MKTELVTNLKRDATKIIHHLRKDKEPILITERGRPAAYLLSVSEFESLQAQLDVLRKIGRGEKAIQEGRLLSHEQARQKMKRWLK